MPHSLALSLVLAAIPIAQDPTPPDAASALAQEILAAIDMPAPKDRRAAVLAIVKRKDVTLPLVRQAIDAATQFPAATPGVHVERAPLWADGKIEDTELVVFVPKSYDPKTPAPLLITFHGTGGSGNGEDQMWRPVCEKLGMLLIAPSEAGPNEGYAYSKRERDSSLGALRWMQRHYNVDAGRVFASGISRGGHLAWDLALRSPDRFAALAPMIGAPRFQLLRNQNNLRFLENLVDMPIRDLQGSQDDPAMLQNLHEAFAKLEQMQAKDVKLIEFKDLGHSFEFGAVDWAEFFGRGRRNPTRDKIVFLSADLEEARSYWVEIEQFTKDVVANPKLSVDQATWAKLDASGQRAWMQGEVDKHTARLEITQKAPGVFQANAKGVVSLRLLLTESMFDPKMPVEVQLNGKTTKKKAVPEVRVLLSEFVERIDRTFLPVASLEVP